LAWSWWLTRWGVDVQVTALTDDPLPPALAEALDSALGDHVYAEDMTDLNAVVVNALSAKGWTMAVAESCTGGLIGAAITDVEGASAVFNGGALTYANSAKTNVLNVSEGLLAEHGAVSSPVAEAMATGARSLLGCDVALSVTGIAGPDGGSDDKPVGTTCIGLASPHGVWSKRLRFRSFRGRNRELAVSHALDAMRRYLASSTTPWSETAG
jgi:nicotinamide-nucleotide amidase